jgi:PspAB-like protein
MAMNFFFRKSKKNILSNNKKPKTDSDNLFSLSSACLTLETKLGLKSAGKCGLSLKNVSGTHFNEMKEEIRRFLDISKSDFELDYRMVIDNYDYLWIILEAKGMEDILAGIAAVGDTIEEKGFCRQLLVSVFEFINMEEIGDQNHQHYYLVYNYKDNIFYPFVPQGNQSRNTENEMKLMATVGHEIPFERDSSLWYPLWNLPF